MAAAAQRRSSGISCQKAAFRPSITAAARAVETQTLAARISAWGGPWPSGNARKLATHHVADATATAYIPILNIKMR